MKPIKLTKLTRTELKNVFGGGNPTPQPVECRNDTDCTRKYGNNAIFTNCSDGSLTIAYLKCTTGACAITSQCP